MHKYTPPRGSQGRKARVCKFSPKSKQVDRRPKKSIGPKKLLRFGWKSVFGRISVWRIPRCWSRCTPGRGRAKFYFFRPFSDFVEKTNSITFVPKSKGIKIRTFIKIGAIFPRIPWQPRSESKRFLALGNLSYAAKIILEQTEKFVFSSPTAAKSIRPEGFNK